MSHEILTKARELIRPDGNTPCLTINSLDILLNCVNGSKVQNPGLIDYKDYQRVSQQKTTCLFEIDRQCQSGVDN